MKLLTFTLMITVMLGSAELASSHEMRPAYLEIRETVAYIYDVTWKVPARGENERLSLHLQFADDVEIIGEPVSAFIADAHVLRMQVKRHGGLTGTPVTILGLAGTYTDVLLRFIQRNGTEVTTRLTPDSPTYLIQDKPGYGQIAWSYFLLGIEHILFGIDHLLFVLVLLLVVKDWWKLISTVTAFTVAHSVTLALATLGLVHVPGPPVEAIIALSILFVAAEITRESKGEPGLTTRKPWIVAFSFGLLHGFGFAGALTEIGLPQSSIPLALLAFNIGVEAGQLIFILTMLCMFVVVKQLQITLPSWSYQIPVYGVGSIAAFWVIERIAGFWP